MRVEHVDTDSSGVVHFSRYASMAETAFLRWLSRIGAGLEAFHQNALDLCVSNMEIKYLQPAKFPDELYFEPELLKVGSVRFKARITISRNEKFNDVSKLAECDLTFVSLDRTSWKPTAIHNDLISILKEVAL